MKKLRTVFVLLIAFLSACALTGTALAQTIRIGAVASATGGASALGEPERNTFLMLQDQLDEAGGLRGVPVEIVFLDDATDAQQAVTNVRRLIEEDEVHLVICCTTSGNSLAIVDLVQEAEVPTISLAAAVQIIAPVEERRWVFKTPQTDVLMIQQGIVPDMAANGYTTLAFLGQEGAFGEGGLLALEEVAADAGIDIVATERFGRDDTDASAQALSVLSADPDAALVWGTVRDSALVVNALAELGYGGQVYVSHGVGNPGFLEAVGVNGEGVRLPIGPMIVVDEMADDNPVKAVALDYVASYEARFGEGSASTFGGHAWDAVQLALKAVGELIDDGADLADLTAARAAIRDQLEASSEFVGVGGVFDFTAEDHLGLDDRALVMVEIEDNDWTLSAP